MDNLSALSTLYKTTPVATDAVVRTRYGQSDDNGFASVLEAAKNLITETNSAQVNAQNEEIKFALGYADNTHDLFDLFSFDRVGADNIIERILNHYVSNLADFFLADVGVPDIFIPTLFVTFECCRTFPFLNTVC